jgi:NAD(P)-dependent dehydrogenase (short-subunit alcohol dehydrogenase family)
MTLSTEAIAIVTGGASWTARQLTRGLASWDWAIVVVYLEHQREAETTVAEILAAEGRTVAVRADLTDELDVERLFAESVAAFAASTSSPTPRPRAAPSSIGRRRSISAAEG